MKTVILGLPNSGKTSVYNALTGDGAATLTYSTGRLEPNISVVAVPDPRIDQLAALYNPTKVTRATVQVVDVAGFNGERRSNETLPGEVLNFLRTADALIHVIRLFEDSSVAHPFQTIDPRADYLRIEQELIFSDLVVTENRIERLDKEIRKLKGSDQKSRQAEYETLLKVRAHLEDGEPLRTLEFADEEQKLLRGFQFLSVKPVLVVLNVGEEQLNQKISLEMEFPEADSIVLSGKIEAELAQLDPDDAAEFMADLGLPQRARDRVIEKVYELLGLISFFTVGEDEVKAWTVVRGATAVEAGRTIHSDIQKGFIRAEVVPWKELMAAGGMAGARQGGTLRLEGRDYLVKDGDISHFRFNV